MSIREELEIEKLKSEVRNLSAGTRKTFAEIRKIERETLWLPVVAVASLAAALLAFLKLVS